MCYIDRMFKTPLDPHKGVGLVAIKMCGVVEGCLYGPSATKIPLGTIREEKGISSRSKFLSCRDMTLEAVESDVKTHFILSSSLPQNLSHKNSSKGIDEQIDYME